MSYKIINREIQKHHGFDSLEGRQFGVGMFEGDTILES